MSAPAVAARELEVVLDGRPALGPLTLAVEPGEHALVVGPSGSGKTTLLRALAGLVPLRHGRVELFGQLATDGARVLLPPERREVGFLFQGGALWPHLSVRRTLEFVLRARRVPRRDWPDQVRRLVTLVDLEGYEARKPGTLSGGEGQRLALARALAAAPRVLLLDEPLGPLDAVRRRELLERLERLRLELSLTVLHVTHDPDEAAAAGVTRRLVLEAGRLVDQEAA